MPLATYKDLCIDAVDAHAEGAFWATMLDLEHHPHDDGGSCLRATGGQVLVWVNRVPEATTVKNRVHLDVNVESVSRAYDAGATLVEAFARWTTLHDPDGQEFCVFERPAPITQRLYELVWNCPEGPQASHDQAAWWAEVLGGTVVDDDSGYSWLEAIPGTPFFSMDFVGVPEPKSAKNRVHLDVTTDDVDSLLAHGATVLRGPADGVEHLVLADPDGNEFCAATP
jgi:catechol 2,3-dioxygenase-like lactoylglutathione lyase family enzyme